LAETIILLETTRLALRRFRGDDVDRLVELDSDPEVMRYITYGVPTPRETYVDTILPRWFQIYEESPLLGYWAAERIGSGEFLGWFHLRTDRFEPEYLELGYRLRRAVWGQGLATEGGRALVRHGFERAGAGRVSSRTLARNLGSQRVMEKCGLRLAGTFVYPEDVLAGRTEDERAAVKYAITREEWLARRP
jgi:RimJ/RimL family protein N-acetyltransferase